LGAVFGIFTRDFRENVEQCRILVTVPQCLEILLLSPHHQGWCQKIQYCIFDEIHCMSGETGSDVWERTMLLINCPMIGLSATVNNGQSLRDWIDSVEKERHRLFKTSKPREVCFISHEERLADLNKYLYSNGQLHPLHPIGLMDAKQVTTRGLPKDFSLSPRETLQLKDALENNGVNTDTIPTLTEHFSPAWIIERNSSNKYSHLVREQFDLLLNSKQNSTIDSIAQSLNPLKWSGISYPEEKVISSLIVEFMLTLQEKNLLPCIVFSDSRWLCERMANSVANYFIQLEEQLRATKYKQRIEEIKQRLLQIEIDKRKAKNKKSAKPSKRRNNEDNPPELQTIDELPGHEQQLLDGILDECTLANQRVCNKERVDTFLTKASKDNPRLVSYMKRGVAFHHANVNNKGRVAVEALFRDRYVQLIFSTSTLGKSN
jgi:superfamily II RNA helicase